MGVADGARPLSILCLHGYSMTGGMMENMMRRFVNRVAAMIVQQLWSAGTDGRVSFAFLGLTARFTA